MLTNLNVEGDVRNIKAGDILVITRKIEKEIKLLVEVKEIVNGNEILLSRKNNDYFNFDMYVSGESWVWRVWNVGRIQLTSITNTMYEFPRS